MTQRIDRGQIEQHPAFQEALSSPDPRKRAEAKGFLEFLDSYQQDVRTGLVNDTRPKFMARPELMPGYEYVAVQVPQLRIGDRVFAFTDVIPNEIAERMASRNNSSESGAGDVLKAGAALALVTKVVEPGVTRPLLTIIEGGAEVAKGVSAVQGLGIAALAVLLANPFASKPFNPQLQPLLPTMEPMAPLWVHVPVKKTRAGTDPEADRSDRINVRDLKELQKEKLPEWIRQMVEDYLRFFDKDALQSEMGIELLKQYLQKELKRLGLQEFMIPDELLTASVPEASPPHKTTGHVQIVASAEADGTAVGGSGGEKTASPKDARRFSDTRVDQFYQTSLASGAVDYNGVESLLVELNAGSADEIRGKTIPLLQFHAQGNPEFALEIAEALQRMVDGKPPLAYRNADVIIRFEEFKKHGAEEDTRKVYLAVLDSDLGLVVPPPAPYMIPGRLTVLQSMWRRLTDKAIASLKAHKLPRFLEGLLERGEQDLSGVMSDFASDDAIPQFMRDTVLKELGLTWNTTTQDVEKEWAPFFLGDNLEYVRPLISSLIRQRSHKRFEGNKDLREAYDEYLLTLSVHYLEQTSALFRETRERLASSAGLANTEEASRYFQAASALLNHSLPDELLTPHIQSIAGLVADLLVRDGDAPTRENVSKASSWPELLAQLNSLKEEGRHPEGFKRLRQAMSGFIDFYNSWRVQAGSFGKFFETVAKGETIGLNLVPVTGLAAAVAIDTGSDCGKGKATLRSLSPLYQIYLITRGDGSIPYGYVGLMEAETGEGLALQIDALNPSTQLDLSGKSLLIEWGRHANDMKAQAASAGTPIVDFFLDRDKGGPAQSQFSNRESIAREAAILRGEKVSKRYPGAKLRERKMFDPSSHDQSLDISLLAEGIEESTDSDYNKLLQFFRSNNWSPLVQHPSLRDASELWRSLTDVNGIDIDAAREISFFIKRLPRRMIDAMKKELIDTYLGEIDVPSDIEAEYKLIDNSGLDGNLVDALIQILQRINSQAYSKGSEEFDRIDDSITTLQRDKEDIKKAINDQLEQLPRFVQWLDRLIGLARRIGSFYEGGQTEPSQSVIMKSPI